MYVIARCGDDKCPAKTTCKRFLKETTEEDYGILVGFCREDDAVNCALYLHREPKTTTNDRVES